MPVEASNGSNLQDLQKLAEAAREQADAARAKNNEKRLATMADTDMVTEGMGQAGVNAAAQANQQLAEAHRDSAEVEPQRAFTSPQGQVHFA